VTVYDDQPALVKVVDEFPMLWDEGGFVNIPKNEWMRIPLRSDWEDKVPKTARIYPVGNKGRKVINDTFNKLHD